MGHFKASKLAVFAAVCLLGIGSNRVAHAQGYTVTNLGGLPGNTVSVAEGINDAGQAVGYSTVGGVDYATEWSNVAVHQPRRFAG